MTSPERPSEPFEWSPASTILVAFGALAVLILADRRRSRPAAVARRPLLDSEHRMSSQPAEPDKGSREEDHYIAIWAKAVDTQMHFNEMSVKSRQLGLTFVAAALGIGVVLLSRGDDFALLLELGPLPLQVHISVILVLAAGLALVAVRGLDLNVYHRMLRGAVTFGEDFEEQYMKRIFQLEKGMTQAISHFSRYADAGASTDNHPKRYTGASTVSAEDKIKEFYSSVLRFLCVSAFILFLLTNVPTWIAAFHGRSASTEQVPAPTHD